MTKKVWVLGDAVVDLLPEENRRLLQCPGGAPANVAVGIARLAGKSAFIGCVGEDAFGDFMREVLHAEGVETRYLRQLAGQRTSTVLVSLDACGERHFTFMVRPGADLFLQPEHLPPFQAGEGLHLCSIALSAEPSRSSAFSAMRALKQAGGWVSFDPNLRDDLWPDKALMRELLDTAFHLADIVKLSLEELAWLSDQQPLEPAMRAFCARYQPSLLLVTQGKAGVTLWRNQQLQHFSAPQVQVVDTTGAGDAFVAGLLAALAQQPDPLAVDDLSAAIAQAQRCGALATTAKGAMTALPYAKDLLPHG
ncbi:aminoimidazole riboside kinase [Pantoea sp. B65]|uniref:aminoimidazole riboside kinase n=1 Tax=Pantoea sp. B65 TaxID=2813359 RepID=UPI0039B5481A